MAQSETRTDKAARDIIGFEAEDDIRDSLRALLEGWGLDRAKSGKVRLRSGEADMVLDEWAVVIEAKSKDVANFTKPASRGQESPLQQLCRYHDELEADPKYAGRKDQWMGVITNGEKWEVYQWKDDSKPVLETSRDFSTGMESDLTVWCENLLKYRRRYSPLPNKPAQVFDPYCHELIFMDLSGLQGSSLTAFTTQKSLWREMLEGSGMAAIAEEDSLFRRHCFLVILARAVEASMELNTLPPEEFMEERVEGFVSWLVNIPSAVSWLKKLYACVLSFDWQSSHKDVLREIYEHTINKEQRHAFGEYYTPGWVAEMVVERVLDEEWLSHSFEAENGPVNGYGVLDPACGSGTFLYHAAKRIWNWLDTSTSATRLQDTQKADIVANLVAGIDIHPVAAELAKITLLTAFPRGIQPSRGRDALRVFQGDGLLADWRTDALIGNPNNGNTYDFTSPRGLNYNVPKFFAERRGFQQEIKTLIDTVLDREEQPPAHLAGKTDEEKSAMLESYESLTKLLASEGDGVWGWRIFNSISPLLLAQQKVNRIIANPPWVRMSSIQDSRKETVVGMMRDHELWTGGKMATSANIASLFVSRTAEEFLAGGRTENFACGWVLPWGSLRGDNWGKLRKQVSPETLDLAEVQESPFAGDVACVWFEGAKFNRKKNEILKNNDISDGKKVLRNRDDWNDAISKLEFSHTKIPSFKPSDYAPDPFPAGFRQGATLLPYSLIKIEKHTCLNGRENIETVEDQKMKWTGSKKNLTGEVPSHWIRNAVDSAHLLPFSFKKPFNEFCVPTDASGDALLDEEEMLKEKFWEIANDCYIKNKSKGINTPETLAECIDHYGKLSVQLQTRRGWVVFYNKSGSSLRSARLNDSNVLCIDQIYWYLCESKEEAGYLVSLLNCDHNQPYFRYSKNSWRHFDLNPIRKVPIPKYDPEKSEHCELAELCTQAEKECQQAAKSINIKTADQSWITRKLREHLRKSKTMHKIDSIAKRIVR